MNKYKFAIFIISITIGIVVLTMIVIYNLNKTSVLKEAESNVKILNGEEYYGSKENNVQTTETNYSEEKVSPNAMIVFNKFYKGCGHTIKNRENVTDKMVNLNRDEFEKLYSDWKVIKFGSNEIELYKEFDGECNEHYLVKENNGFVAIYKIKSDGNIKLQKNTEIALTCLPESDVNSLKEGVTLVGEEELNAYLENFE